MSSGGFIVNDTAPTGITTSFAVAKAMLMHEDVAVDANSLHGALPSQAQLEQVDIRLTHTAGNAPTTATVMFFWDAACDIPMAGPSSAITLAPAGTTASTYLGTATMGQTRPRAPAGQTTKGKCYAMAKVDDGTVTVPLGGLKLHWSDPRGGE